MGRHGLVGAACVLAASAAQGQDFRVLVFSKTVGFRHTSIANGIAAINALGAEHCFAVEVTEDGAQFNAPNLARFGVVVFLSTTGDVLDAGQQTAFETWFRAGGGWVGIHAAADTEYDWPFYGQMMGAYFGGHPAPQTAGSVVETPLHRSTSHLPNPWSRFDEWYNFQSNPRPGRQVLLRLDESTYGGGTMGADHPIAWSHLFQGGRAWYTGGGHTEESYTEPHFVQHLLGGIFWAAGRHGCGCYPNCDGSTEPPALNVNDFVCFQSLFAASNPRADCNLDAALNVNDFVCFQSAFAAGCP